MKFSGQFGNDKGVLVVIWDAMLTIQLEILAITGHVMS